MQRDLLAASAMTIFSWIFLVLFLVALGFLFFATRYSLQTKEETFSTGREFAGRYLLVLLRLAIGWHLLVEGLDKLHSESWTSETYLRESIGPAAPAFRALAGDGLKDRLTAGPTGELPEQLQSAWEAYLATFTGYYNLNEEQKEKATDIFRQSKKKTEHWLASGTRPTKKRARQHVASPPIPMTVAQRIAAYESLEKETQDMEAKVLPTSEKEKLAQYRDLKADVARLRRELKTDLDGQFAEFKKALASVLNDKQKEQALLRDPGKSLWSWSLLDWSDFLVKYGLIVVGGCLLAGLFSRTACLAGAVLLLLFFLAIPPLPGWPENPRAEGHYLYINKNILEMLALLALATTRSGRWVGLDGLIHAAWTALAPWRAQKSLAPDPQPALGKAPPAEAVPFEAAVSPSKEITHGN